MTKKKSLRFCGFGWLGGLFRCFVIAKDDFFGVAPNHFELRWGNGLFLGTSLPVIHRLLGGFIYLVIFGAMHLFGLDQGDHLHEDRLNSPTMFLPFFKLYPCNHLEAIHPTTPAFLFMLTPVLSFCLLQDIAGLSIFGQARNI